MDSGSLTNLTIVFAVALAGGLVGGLKRISEEALHLALSLAAGFFLGAVFLELLPEAFAEGAATAEFVGKLALLGFLLIYIFEKGIVPYALGGRLRDGHSIVAYTALLGLCVHSIAEGGALSMAAQLSETGGESVLLSIVMHKGIAGLALGSLFALADSRRGAVIAYVTLFALMTPLGALVFGSFGQGAALGPHWLQAASALTAGIFLYVATADILPEVMHSKAAIGWKLALLTLGVGVMWLFTHWPGHSH